MSEKVLIIDNPDGCIDCVAGRWNTQKDYAICKAEGKINSEKYKKPSWCPLRPLPERKEEAKEPLATRYYMAEGWNDCLDEITGGKI